MDGLGKGIPKWILEIRIELIGATFRMPSLWSLQFIFITPFAITRSTRYVTMRPLLPQISPVHSH